LLWLLELLELLLLLLLLLEVLSPSKSLPPWLPLLLLPLRLPLLLPLSVLPSVCAAPALQAEEACLSVPRAALLPPMHVLRQLAEDAFPTPLLPALVLPAAAAAAAANRSCSTAAKRE